ncbi:hypothetical protein BLOT_009913 [Blomia tropicalis]|nr:hypothetical protein BLOT_009913 [Blomia tropicalis]
MDELRETFDFTQLCGHRSEVFHCEWNPKNDLLATGCADGTARIWNVCKEDDSLQIGLFHNLQQIYRHAFEKGVTAVRWNHDGNLLATGTADGYTLIWTYEGKLIWSLTEQHTARVNGIRWSKKGTYIATYSSDSTIAVWDVITGKLVQKFTGHTGRVNDFNWKNDDSFVTCSDDKKIIYSKVGLNEPIKILTSHRDKVYNVYWHPYMEHYMASCSDDKHTRLWDMNMFATHKISHAYESGVKMMLIAPTGPKLAFSEDLFVAATVTDHTDIRVSELQKDVPIARMNKHTARINAIALSNNGKFLATCSNDNYVYIWSTQITRLLQIFLSPNKILDLSWSYNDKMLAATGTNGCVYTFPFQLE